MVSSDYVSWLVLLNVHAESIKFRSTGNPILADGSYYPQTRRLLS